MSIRRLAVIFWILIICIILLIIYFSYTLIMFFQVVQLLPILDPETANIWLQFWQIENTQALVLLIALTPVTVVIALYLRVVPPSLDDYAREVTREKEKS